MSGYEGSWHFMTTYIIKNIQSLCRQSTVDKSKLAWSTLVVIEEFWEKRYSFGILLLCDATGSWSSLWYVRALYCEHAPSNIKILIKMPGFLTQLLSLVYVFRTEEDQLLHGLEGSASCWAGEVVEPRAALSMASNGCTQPFAVLAKLKQTHGNM